MNISKSKESLNVKKKIKKVAKAIKSKSNPKLESNPKLKPKVKSKSKKKVKILPGSTNKRKSKSYRKTPYPKKKKKENVSKSPVSLLMFIDNMPPPPKTPEFRTFTKVSKPKDEILKIGIPS